MNRSIIHVAYSLLILFFLCWCDINIYLHLDGMVTLVDNRDSDNALEGSVVYTAEKVPLIYTSDSFSASQPVDTTLVD